MRVAFVFMTLTRKHGSWRSLRALQGDRTRGQQRFLWSGRIVRRVMWAVRLGATCCDGRVESGFLSQLLLLLLGSGLEVKGCFTGFSVSFFRGVYEVWFSFYLSPPGGLESPSLHDALWTGAIRKHSQALTEVRRGEAGVLMQAETTG